MCWLVNMDMNSIKLAYSEFTLNYKNITGCRMNLPNVDCSGNFTTKYENGSCYENSTFIGLWDYQKFQNVTGIQRVLASEEYFK